MFYSIDPGFKNVVANAGGSQKHLYPAVELQTRQPVFVADVMLLSNGRLQERTVMTTQITEIANLKASQLLHCERVELINMTLMSPPCLNGTDSWQLDRLREVRQLPDYGDTEPMPTFFMLSDGRVMSQRFLTEKEISNAQTIFLFEGPPAQIFWDQPPQGSPSIN